MLLTTAAYWPGLGGGFLFDDFPNIVHQDAVHATALDPESLRRAAGAYREIYGRPLATATFAINHVYGGLDPWGYKAANLAVHVVNALLVLLLLVRLRDRDGVPLLAPAAAFVLAALWALHPLQVSTVLYVVQRMESLSIVFVLLALLAYVHGRRRQLDGHRGWPWLGVSALIAAVGLLAKETAVLFPVFALGLELALFRFELAGGRRSRWLVGLYGFGLAAATCVFLVWIAPRYFTAEAYALRDYSAGERLLTQLRVLPMYLGWIVLPRPDAYVFYYDHLQASQSLLEPATTLAGGLLLLALAVSALLLRRRMPLYFLGIFWFFAAHLLTSNVFALELAFEHRNYFALLGVLLAAYALLAPLLPKLGVGARRLVGAALIGGLFAMCLVRSSVWGDPLALAMQMAGGNPASSRASTDLGEQYMVLSGYDPESFMYAMAQAEFERGSRIENASLMPEQGLLVLAANAGVSSRPEWWDRVEHKLRTRAVGPQEMAVMMGLLRSRRDIEVFDDRRFAAAYALLRERALLSAGQNFEFGMHALEYAGDEALAADFFLRSGLAARNDPRFVAGIILTLADAGYRQQAEALAAEMRERGIAEVSLDAAEPAPGTEE
ncbi:hypothetical protein [Arenimonas composti]|uniref:Glycosyltransferase RgtA/B/C/D-like domain-containing protein n=1 Tax=Arenimonas composti TR7-09 = DSM 18010 TaxID=1121013 RepID=A0A091BEX8_9GAMM|nr:hypothetical protein [Arenimonas composti]KFN51258.1 hypothetical protein P873_03055 [Arenimonas composti TR7-09 = DSM 18010]